MEIPQLRASNGATDDFLRHDHDPCDLWRWGDMVYLSCVGLHRAARDPQPLASDGKHRKHPVHAVHAFNLVFGHIGRASISVDYLRGELTL